MKKIVFFDIDGTLLDDQKQLPVSTKKAVQLLQKNGIYTAIATGRNSQMTQDICEDLHINSYVTINGQFSVFEGKEMYTNPIDKKEIRSLLETAKTRNHPLAYYHNENVYVSEDNHPHIRESFRSIHKDYPIVKPNFYEEHPTYQLGLFCREGEEKWYEEHFPSFDFVRWHTYGVDVLPKGCSKLTGIQRMVEKLGITNENVYAFGDGLNDVQMIEGVGVGVAMGNAVEEVKKVADYVTKSNEKDGIYLALQHLKLI